MMRSLWSGVSGLNAHQTGIDVEGNNIANVNTVGFKYSRTNFEDYMSQTTSPAISPQGKLGGKNATQIGSGSTVANIQQIHSQGATQGTDNDTDMSINGEGFFVVSGNGGNSYQYTRAGNFTFDANGNLVNPNGMIVQGWLADKNYEINSTGGLNNITVDQGLTTPAKATGQVNIVANLNSGTSVGEGERSPATSTVTPTKNFNDLYDYKGDKIALKENIDKLNLILTRTYDANGTAVESTSTHVFTYGEGANQSDGFFTTVQELLDEINFKIADSTGIHDNKVLLNGDGQIAAAGHIVAVNSSTNPKVATTTADLNTIRTYDGKDAGLTNGEQVQIVFDSSTGISSPKNYVYGSSFSPSGTDDLATASSDFAITADQQIEIAFDTTSGATGTANLVYGTDFTTINDLVNAINTEITNAGGTGTVSYDEDTGSLSDDTGVVSTVNALDSTGAAPGAGTDLESFDTILASLTGAGTSADFSSATPASGDSAFSTISELISAVNADVVAAGGTGTISYNSESGFISDDSAIIKSASALNASGAVPSTGSALQNFNDILSTLGGADTHTQTIRGDSFYTNPTTNSVLADVLQKSTEGFYLSRSLKAVENGFIGADDVGELFNSNGEAIMLSSGEGVKFSVDQLGETRNFIYRDPSNTNKNSYLTNDFQDPSDVTVADSSQGFRWMKDSNGEDAFMTVGQKINVTFDSAASNGLTTKTYTYGTSDGFQTIDELLLKINTDLSQASSGAATTKNVTYDSINGWIEDSGNVLLGMNAIDKSGNAPTTDTPLDKLNTLLAGIDSTVNSHTGVMKKNDTYYFTDTQELVNLYQDSIDDAGSPTNYINPITGTVSMDDDGRITISNSGSTPFNVETTGYPNDLDANTRFLNSLSAFNTTVSSNSYVASERLLAANHSTSIEVYDSSGSKIQVTLNFRKEQTSSNNSEATTWKWYAEAPEPATFEYPSFGEVQFNLDGSVKSYSPPSMTLNANTGSSSGQSIQLKLGDVNGFNGLTSFADESITKNQSQDGYAGGSLEDLSVDRLGNIIGGFTNGKTFKLAQVGMATFANNEGLVKEGSNLYTASANSGTAQVGAANTSNRGEISPQTLEMSNVDLSQSLTNLIVIQRGFQANSKTITTSDQMLNTLLQLKQ